MGITPTQMAEAVKEAGASIIGANCGNGFDNMIDIVKEIRMADKMTPVLRYQLSQLWHLSQA